jgi:signal transduction histidine kinase
MYPFPLRKLLTSLEWTLLAIVAISQIFYLIFSRELNTYILLTYNCVGFIVFLELGKMKISNFSLQIIYTIAELIWALSWASIGDLFVPTPLFAIVVIRSYSRVNEFSRAVILVLALLSSIVVQTQRTIAGNSLLPAFVKQSWKFWLAFICILLISFLFLYLMLNAALKYHRIQMELAAANDRLKIYATRVEELATAQERNRIARELHDSLGHSLTGFSIHLEASLRLLRVNPDKAEALLMQLKKLNAKALMEVRQSIAELRIEPLHGKTLILAITDLANEFQSSTGIKPAITYMVEELLPTELNTAIYRIVQESLTNICKYAAATAVEIEVVKSSRELKVTIVDNGKGFDPTQNTTGFGLQGMSERASVLGGGLKVIAVEGSGCRIVATFPGETIVC